MSCKQLPRRSCKNCGAPSDNRALCAICSPHRATQGHQDKYAQLSQPQPKKTIAELEREILARREAKVKPIP